MSSLNENLSNLEIARLLSSQLSVAPSAAGRPGQSEEPPEYVRFSSSQVLGDASPSGHGTAERQAGFPAPPEIPDEPQRFQSWMGLLNWCQEASDAETVFVVDAQGFIIANLGQMAFEEIEAVGTQLMATLQEADRIEHGGGAPLGITLQFSSFWLSGLRAAHRQLGAFILAVVSERLPGNAITGALQRQFQENINHL